MGWKETLGAVATGMIAFTSYVWPADIASFFDSIVPNAGYYAVRLVFLVASVAFVIIVAHSFYEWRQKRRRQKTKPAIVPQPEPSLQENRSRFEAMIWESDVGWHLPSTEQPPPYGKFEIKGSEKDSKLHCRQHGYNLELTGEMKRLKPNTSYTVYIGKCVTPHTLRPNTPDTIIRSDIVPHGNWQKFLTNEHGSGSWTVHANIDDLAKRARVGELDCIQVWLNDAVVGPSVLDSGYVTIRSEREA